jgi:hypothetical protein
MRNKLLCAVLLALILCCLQLGAPWKASACSCVTPASALDALQGADVVFLGTVTRITSVNQTNTWASKEVAFSVSDVWKGAVAPRTLLVTGSGAGDCGYVFTRGDTYLVYAYASNPGSPVFSIGDIRIEIPLTSRQLSTAICTRTAPLAQAATDLAQLGPGAQPAQVDLIRLVLDNLLAVIAGVVALVIVLILYLLRRKRRRTFRLKP